MSLPQGFIALVSPSVLSPEGHVVGDTTAAPTSPVFVLCTLITAGEMRWYGGDIGQKLREYPRHVLYGGPATRSNVAAIRSAVDNWAWNLPREAGGPYWVTWVQPGGYIDIVPEGVAGVRWPYHDFRWVSTVDYAPTPYHRIVYRGLAPETLDYVKSV